MSNTTIGMLMLPVLALLLLLLECSRMGCVWLVKRLRETRSRAGTAHVGGLDPGVEG